MSGHRPFARRLLDLTDVSEEARGDPSPVLGQGDRVVALTAHDDLVDMALGLVTTSAAVTVVGSDGVSVSLERHGRLTTVASTNDTVRAMDSHQYETGQGPCLAAAASGHRFHIPVLESELRWPDFVNRALDEGIASILSTPLFATDRPVGALNIYTNVDEAFGAPQHEVAGHLAAKASALLDASGAPTG